MRDILRMTPGPTYVTERVRRAMAMPLLNPDLEDEFFEKVHGVQEMLKDLYHTEGEVLILNGEGILGLEAACASFIEKGDRVLCIDNGIFGHGFIDFVELYGGEVTVLRSPYDEPVKAEELKLFLKENQGFKVATLVHCETPAGITNPVSEICPLLHEHGILSVVDSVSALGGEPLQMDEWNMDVVLGASQKCLSAPPGLTLVAMGERAKEILETRKTPVSGFYLNLGIWKDWHEKKWFPYSQPVSDIYALEEALKVIQEEGDYLTRHDVLSKAVREAVMASGLKLYGKSGYSSTVTTVLLPPGVSFKDLQTEMVGKHGVLMGGAFDYLGNQVFRIGHMGENAREDKLYMTLKALHYSLISLGVQLQVPMHEIFVREMRLNNKEYI